jgi:hypothetical protein
MNIWFAILLGVLATPVAASELPPPTIYPYLLDPTVYPDYLRRPNLVPTWDTFQGHAQFVALRHLPEPDYKNQDLGLVCMPGIDIATKPGLAAGLDEMKKRGYYLFDIGGYVPGTPKWQLRVTPETSRLMKDKLGDHFLGFDVGEDDARYLFLMRQIETPYAATREAQCTQAYKYFSHIYDDLGDRLNTLMEYWYWPYPIKEGSITIAGAETQNRVTSSSIQYAFLRGAGKQYGVPWFGNVATFTTWDYKSYDKSLMTFFGNTSPTKGNSLALMRRLMISQYLYNSVVLGFEGAMFTDAWWSPHGDGPLSPLGQVQQDAVRFVNAHPQPGVMQTPVALLLDYYAGWIPARTLTSCYQVWGYLPYDGGDYLTHNIFKMLQPSYEDCGWYHDERGTLCDNPYGDIADVIHTDAAAGILEQYGVVVAAGNLFKTDAEVRTKLNAYVSGGGCLIATAENARHLWPSLRVGAPRRLPAGSTVTWANGEATSEPLAFDLCDVSALPPGSTVLAKCGALAAVTRIPYGNGSILLLHSPFGINAEPLAQGELLHHEPDQPLAQPYVLLAHARKLLDAAFRSQQLFSAGNDALGFLVCRKGAGDYTIGVFNNSLHSQPFQITSHCGAIQQLTELSFGRDVHNEPGYWPRDFQKNDGGVSDATHISGGDVRLFSVQVQEAGVKVLPKVKPPARPSGRLLALRNIADVREEIQRRPTFFEHFDGVKVDWTYLLRRDNGQMEVDRRWFERQKLRVLVDFTPDMNDFPGLTLMDALPESYADSVKQIDNVLGKMQAGGITEAIICTHMPPELGVTPQQIHDSFERGIGDLCKRAQARGITIYLENETGHWMDKVPETLHVIDEVAAPNLRFALNASHVNLSEALAQAGSRLALVLASAAGKDVPPAQMPLSSAAVDKAVWNSIHAPVVLDADYPDSDTLYRDIQALWN